MAKDFSQKKLSKIFGLNKDREGLITRYFNEQKNWESHIQQTKQFILKAAENKKKGLGVILGSGWWLDLPYHELSSIFERLIFIDITHPNQIIHKAKKFPNIELVEADISGALLPLYEMFKQKKQDLDITKLNIENKLGIPNDIQADFVVSLNLLNQLSFFSKNYLNKKKLVSNDKINEIVKLIEQTHINNLPINKSCLITDYYQYEYDQEGILLNESKRLSVELPINSSREEWVWDFDLSGNFINNRKVKFKCAALQV